MNEGTLSIPALGWRRVEVRVAPLTQRDRFAPPDWRHETLRVGAVEGFLELDLGTLALPDGEYEYEFILDGDEAHALPDPFAQRITRFGGYRGVFSIADGSIA